MYPGLLLHQKKTYGQPPPEHRRETMVYPARMAPGFTCCFSQPGKRARVFFAVTVKATEPGLLPGDRRRCPAQDNGLRALTVVQDDGFAQPAAARKKNPNQEPPGSELGLADTGQGRLPEKRRYRHAPLLSITRLYHSAESLGMRCCVA